MAEDRIMLTLEYDGTDYVGWQVQPNGPSVQAEVERALEDLLKNPVRVVGSGRTDSGVHALGQTCSFTPKADIPLKGYFYGLNSILPPDVRVKRVARMDAGFDSRRSAVDKTYRYRYSLSPVKSAFDRRTSWWLGPGFDMESAREGGAHLVGIHDFEAFRSAGCDAEHGVREVKQLELVREGDFVDLWITGSGFLRNMVRIIAGTLAEVGMGKRPPDSVLELIEGRDRTVAGITAPPQGLFLVEVNYGVEPNEKYPDG